MQQVSGCVILFVLHDDDGEGDDDDDDDDGDDDDDIDIAFTATLLSTECVSLKKTSDSLAVGRSITRGYCDTFPLDQASLICPHSFPLGPPLDHIRLVPDRRGRRRTRQSPPIQL